MLKQVFDRESTQEEVFDTTAREVVLGALDGYNGTLFAYGQVRCTVVNRVCNAPWVNRSRCCDVTRTRRDPARRTQSKVATNTPSEDSFRGKV